MNELTKIAEGLYRLYVPFEELKTAVFFGVYGSEAVIIDSATYPSDVESYILPALKELGIGPSDVKYIALTHKHGDHSGGAERLSALLPFAEVRSPEKIKGLDATLIGDGEILLGGLRAVALSGHTSACIGYLDQRSGTLLSGDCLQLGGVGKYTNGIGNAELYRASVEQVRQMAATGEVKKIVASHEYVPLGSTAEGKKEIETYLNTCLEYINGKQI